MTKVFTHPAFLAFLVLIISLYAFSWLLYLFMPRVSIILKKEISHFMSSLIAYIVIGVFLTGIGLFMWIYPETNVLDYGYADMESLFSLSPYVFLFLIPAVTMRTFAEEKRLGTMQLLLTHPLRDWDIIWGKYLGSLTLVLFALLPTLLSFYSVYELGNPTGNLDISGTIGSYLGLILLGATFTSVGIFASSITNNQIVSFIVAVFLCYVLFIGFASLANLNDTSDFSYYISQIGIAYHYEYLRKGLVDSRNVLYFFSVIVGMLLATKFVLNTQKQ